MERVEAWRLHKTQLTQVQLDFEKFDRKVDQGPRKRVFTVSGQTDPHTQSFYIPSTDCEMFSGIFIWFENLSRIFNCVWLDFDFLTVLIPKLNFKSTKKRIFVLECKFPSNFFFPRNYAITQNVIRRNI
jgi:hypothetical protein